MIVLNYFAAPPASILTYTIIETNTCRFDGRECLRDNSKFVSRHILRQWFPNTLDRGPIFGVKESPRATTFRHNI